MVFAVIAASCSSSKTASTAAAPAAATTTPAGATTTAASPATTAASVTPASGTPVKVVSIVSPGTGDDNSAGLQAGVKAINAEGGLKGRPVDLTICTDNNDANTAAKCARDAVDDPSVVAIVDQSGSYGASVYPILEAGRLPALGSQIFGQTDAKSPMTFESSAGIFNSIASAKLAVQQLGAKKIGVPYVDIPAGAQLPPFITAIIKPLGGSVVGAIPVPLTAGDVTSQVANELAASPDAIIDGLTVEQYTKFIQTTRQQGSSVPFLVSAGVFDASQIKDRLAGANSNIYIIGEYNHLSDGYQQFLKDIDTYNKSYGNRNDSVLSGWIALKMLQFAGNKAATVDRAGILAVMNATTDFDVSGLMGPTDYTKPQTGLGGSLPRVVNDAIYVYKYQDGKEVAVNGSPAVHLFS